MGGEVVGQSAAPEAKDERLQATDQEGVILMVHADTAEKQAKAEELLRGCGATRVWRQGGV